MRNDGSSTTCAGRSLSYAHGSSEPSVNGPPGTRTSPLVVTRGSSLGPVKPAEGERLRHRLDVLKLVLHDHSDEEVVPRQLGEPLEHLLAYLRDVGARAPGATGSAAAPARRARVRTSRTGRRGAAAAVAASEQPELLEVPDVSEIPDERRLERRDLARQLLRPKAAPARLQFAVARDRGPLRAQ